MTSSFPQTPPPQWQTIPDELKAIAQWVNWRWALARDGKRDTKLTKLPYDAATGEMGDATDPTTWHDYTTAKRGVLLGQFPGLGFVVTETDLYCGIDLDKCRDPESGEIEPWALREIQRFNSYAEVTVSGTGIRIWLRGTKGSNPRCRVGHVECYDRERFFTLTGWHLDGTRTTIEPRQTELDAFLAQHLPAQPNREPQPPQTPRPMARSDAEIIERATNARNGADFAALWRGDRSGHDENWSSADLALCNHLAFWTDGDAGTIDRLFRQSGLMRDKWEKRQDYRERTIARAIDSLPVRMAAPASVGALALNGSGPRLHVVAGASTHAEMRDNQSVGDKGHHTDAQHELNENDELTPPPSLSPGVTSSNSFNSSRGEAETGYPKPLGEAAYHGVIGTITRLIEPQTESDPVAILVQLLSAFGNAAGRRSHFVVENTRHYPVLDPVLVGSTAKGRKGTSWNHVRYVMHTVDKDWTDEHVAGGLSSGEGVIHRLRDGDPDISDKRLLCFEGEFSSVLAMAARKGNILSQILRQAFDGDVLQALTKQSPERASDAHVSIIGHITRDELLRYLTETDAANGFGNRFLWLAVRRSKLLAEGGDTDQLRADLTPRLATLHEALTFAQVPRPLTRNTSARALWIGEYPRLSSGHGGLFGAMTARAEAQVTRLSCVYALLDQSALITEPHLRAALEIWRYAEDSARYIFGDRLGDEVADAIITELRARAPGGMTRTDISTLLGHNVKSARIAQALRQLQEVGLARSERDTDTNGRPAEVWYALAATKERSTKETK
jgi:hypothetical protein